MITSRDRNKWRHMDSIEMRTYKFERVDRFKYLGSFIMENNETSEEINAGLKEGNRCYWAFINQDLSNKNKENIYRL